MFDHKEIKNNMELLRGAGRGVGRDGGRNSVEAFKSLQDSYDFIRSV